MIRSAKAGQLLIILASVLVYYSCLARSAGDTSEQRPPAPAAQSRQQSANPEVQTATFALG